MESSINTGYISVHRTLMDKSYYNRSQYVHLWLHLLLKANHTGKNRIWNGREIIIKPGQLLTGRIVLSEETGIPQSTIEKILNFFEKNKQVEQQKNSRNRIITIVSWHKFQKRNNKITSEEQQKDNQGTTKEQPRNTNNNDNNDNNVNNDNNEIIKASASEKKLNFNFVAESVKNDFLEFILTKKKKPKTQNEVEAIYQHLQQLSNKNLLAAREILKQSIRNQWQDLYPLNESQTPKTNKNGKQTSNNSKLGNLRSAAANIIQSASNTGHSE